MKLYVIEGKIEKGLKFTITEKKVLSYKEGEILEFTDGMFVSKHYPLY